MADLWNKKPSAIVTGGGSGIGKGLCLELARRGCRVTVADVNDAGTAATVEEIKRQGGTAIAVLCDVLDKGQQAAMFQRHLDAFGSLDIVILNAGISENGSFLAERETNWVKTLDIDLNAVLVGTRLAARHMIQRNIQGRIVLVASAGGLYPMAMAPVYSAAKAGVVQFARSIARPLAERGIAISALCPQPTDTPMVHKWFTSGDELPETGTATLSVDQVVAGAIMLLEDPKPMGKGLMVHVNGKYYQWQFSKDNMKRLPAPGEKGPGSVSRPKDRAAQAQWLQTASLTINRKIQVFKLSVDFADCTRIVSEQLPPSLPEGHVLMRRIWAGINASDVNFTSGRYFGSPEEAAKKLPFDAGFEAVGVVAGIGPGVTGFEVGDAVAQLGYGTFSEYGLVPAKQALPLPRATPEAVALLTSGLTASIGLEVAGRMRSGETVLVTAAAGGTGQFAVQLAKAAGNKVVATCGGEEKATLLRRLGADRVINYHKEDVKAVLRAEFPKGVDIVYESVGGDMFKTCLGALAKNGRLVVIGMMSQYGSGWKPSQLTGLPEMLLWKSASVTGFFLLNHTAKYRQHLHALMRAQLSGKLHVALDPTLFRGLESVPAAVQHLQSGKSLGKVVVQIPATVPLLPPLADSKL